MSSTARMSSRVLVLALLVLGDPPQRARACSCVGREGGWLTSSGDAPADVRGAVWYGVDTGDALELARIAREVRVERYTCDEVRVVAALAEVVDAHSVLIVPAEPMRPGEGWRFVHVDPGGRQPERSIALHVRERALASMQERPILRLGPPSWGPLVVSASASCWSEITATQHTLELELPPAFRGIEGALLFYTEVDGRRWSPSHSRCARAPPGRSWTALASELLYGFCHHGGKPAAVWGDAGLRDGPHRVTMRAVLPGTRVALVAGPVRFTLRCERAADRRP